MADYISREAAVNAFFPVDPENDGSDGTTPIYLERDYSNNEIESILWEIDAADVAPVVPCKGCEHAERYARTDGTAGYYCGHPQNTFVYGERWDRVFKPVKKPDDFCSFGEPRGAKKMKQIDLDAPAADVEVENEG